MWNKLAMQPVYFATKTLHINDCNCYFRTSISVQEHACYQLILTDSHNSQGSECDYIVNSDGVDGYLRTSMILFLINVLLRKFFACCNNRLLIL